MVAELFYMHVPMKVCISNWKFPCWVLICRTLRNSNSCQRDVIMNFGLFSEHKIPHFCFFHLQCLANSKSSMATGRVALGRVAHGGHIGGQNLSKQLAVGWWITWFSSSWEENNCYQTWANSQNDNYFHSKWAKVVILSENSCHVSNFLSFDNSYFLLSLR